MSFNFKFLPIKDLIFSVIPTIGTYLGYLQGLTPEWFPNPYVAIGIGLIASVILAMVFYRENVHRYKKSLAEILATGYFLNFTERLGRLLKAKDPFKVLYGDLANTPVYPKNIFVEIVLPTSLDALKSYADRVDKKTRMIFLENPLSGEPIWLKGQLDKNKITVYEFPRTLFTIGNYMKTEFINPKTSEQRSKKLFSYFNNKIEELRIERSSDLPVSNLVFKTI